MNEVLLFSEGAIAFDIFHLNLIFMTLIPLFFLRSILHQKYFISLLIHTCTIGGRSRETFQMPAR